MDRYRVRRPFPPGGPSGLNRRYGEPRPYEERFPTPMPGIRPRGYNDWDRDPYRCERWPNDERFENSWHNDRYFSSGDPGYQGFHEEPPGEDDSLHPLYWKGPRDEVRQYLDDNQMSRNDSNRQPSTSGPLKSILKKSQPPPKDELVNSNSNSNNGHFSKSGGDSDSTLPIIPAVGFDSVEDEDGFLYSNDAKDASETSRLEIDARIGEDSHDSPNRNPMSDYDERLCIKEPSWLNNSTERPSSPVASYRQIPPSNSDIGPSVLKDSPVIDSSLPSRFPSSSRIGCPDPSDVEPFEMENKRRAVPVPSEEDQTDVNTPTPGSAVSSFINKPMTAIPKIPKLSEKSNPSNNSVPKETDIADREKLRNQLAKLQDLLEKTSKKGGDLLRNSKRRDAHMDPQYIENVTLQRDVEKRIEEVKGKLFEIERRLGCPKEGPKEKEASLNDAIAIRPVFSSSQAIEEECNDKEYIDPKDHWCKNCDVFINDLPSYLEHLHSKDHWKHVDTKEEPWRSKTSKAKNEDDLVKVEKPQHPMKGMHLLVPVKGYYCGICGVFTGSLAHAEEHLKSSIHNRAYYRHALQTPLYERNYDIEKSRSKIRFMKEEKKRQREQEEKEERDKESKRRATEAEMRKKERILKEKADEENKQRRARESEEKESRHFKEISRNRERERERDREREREKEKDRGRERERDRDRERDRERNFFKYPSNKDRERERPHEEEKEKHKERNRDTQDSTKSERPDTHKSKENEFMDDSLYGPHFPYRDRKLGMKTLVAIPANEWQKCYQKHLKLALKSKKKLAKTNPSEVVFTCGNSTLTKDEPKGKEDKYKEKEGRIKEEPSDVDSSIGNIISSIKFDHDSDDESAANKPSTSTLHDIFTIEPDDDDDEENLKRRNLIAQGPITFTASRLKIEEDDCDNPSNKATIRKSSCEKGKVSEKKDSEDAHSLVSEDTIGGADERSLTSTSNSSPRRSSDENVDPKRKLYSVDSIAIKEPGVEAKNSISRDVSNTNNNVFCLTPCDSELDKDNDNEKSVMDHLIAIEKECDRIGESNDKAKEKESDSEQEANHRNDNTFPTMDLNDLAKSPPYHNFTSMEDSFPNLE